MSEIPEDIMAAVRRRYIERNDVRNIATREGIFRGDADKSASLSLGDVGRLVAAERERCARIADFVPTPIDIQDHMMRAGYISASQAIAAAIRNPEPPKE